MFSHDIEANISKIIGDILSPPAGSYSQACGCENLNAGTQRVGGFVEPPRQRDFREASLATQPARPDT